MIYAIACSIIYATKTRPASANPKIWNQQLWIKKLNLKCILKMNPYSILRKKHKMSKKKFFFKIEPGGFFPRNRNRSTCFTNTHTTCINYLCYNQFQQTVCVPCFFVACEWIVTIIGTRQLLRLSIAIDDKVKQDKKATDFQYLPNI